MNAPFVPRRTRLEMASPASPGGRHDQARRIIFSLVGQGLYSEAVFAQVRGLYDPDFNDAEIWNLIRGAQTKNPQPVRHGRHLNSPLPRPAPVVKPENAVANAVRFLNGFRCDEADLFDASPWRPLEDPGMDALPLLAGLFHADDLVNICAGYGPGTTMRRNDWMANIRDHGVPVGDGGGYFRPNPVSGKPTGDGGGYTDADVAAHRFAVIESDVLPLDLQLSVIATLPLPIAAVIYSGNRSFHALIQIAAPNAEAYRSQVHRVLVALRQLGFDQSTGNPSRMSRLPGATRGSQQQKLVYLAPDATQDVPIFGGAK
jgi:hypothetical protein